VAAEAADAYMQVRGAQLRLVFAKEQIATDDHLLQLVSQRGAAGIASDRELAQAEAVLAQAKASVPQIQITLEAQLHRLDVLMGAQPVTYASELKTAADIPAVPAIASFVEPSELMRRRLYSLEAPGLPPRLLTRHAEALASGHRCGRGGSD
jgi:outer membrane protein TolC